MTCPRCSTGKAKRSCLGLDTAICPKCCAAGREGDVKCPLTCEYLIAAHRFEKKTADPKAMPSADIPIDNNFLRVNEYLIAHIGSSLLYAVHLQTDVDDKDLLAVLSYMVSVWRERTQGVIKEPYVADRAVALIADRVATEIIAHQQQSIKRHGSCASAFEVLRSLVFLQRTCFGLQNGRPRCTAFLAFLKETMPYEKTGKDEPLVVLA